MNNAYLIVKDGKVIGEGEGRMPTLQPGEEFRWRDSLADVAKEPVIIAQREREQAQNDVEQANKQRDTQVYINKAACAREFLANVPDTGETGDPSVIPAECKDLFDEYSETHDLIDISPWDLARKIVEKSDKSQTEAQRRRKKLLAQQTLNKPLPEAPHE